ncbi:hypothetical protein ABMA70_01730 [Halobacteriovorax sp. XZX-3]|uniref:hypothetical protein n=1 Tax=unclassified Halobacteriovorax TaxID=2639665 RepID=UPI000CD315DA|nr:hypothetical protein [Halobacteriovorax sp. DA5]POB14468.1 hypothetical protein C0Z22_05075 [Halobacteriovorax sp. DA5]
MKILLTLLCALLTFSALATTSERNPHEYQILAHEDLGSEVKEQDFYFVVVEALRLYQDEAIKQKRGISVKTLDWQTPYFSAWALYDDKADHFNINFWGGFARMPNMTKRAYAFTACHEIGHVLGKAPRMENKHFSQMSTEGQSDFFAAASCYKKFVINNPNYFDSPIELDPYAASLCLEKFSSDNFNQELCFETMQVAQDFPKAIAHMSSDPNKHAKITNSDPTTVTKTLDSYPTLQCRMDIIKNGALLEFSGDEISIKNLESRLPCWFANSATSHIH